MQSETLVGISCFTGFKSSSFSIAFRSVAHGKNDY